MRLRDSQIGAVAQLGERLVRNEEVSGSIPLSSTKYSGQMESVVFAKPTMHLREAP